MSDAVHEVSSNRRRTRRSDDRSTVVARAWNWPPGDGNDPQADDAVRFTRTGVIARLDPTRLPARDRATLRILWRAEAATAEQLAMLVYGRLRTAQRRLRALWMAGYLDRTVLAPPRGRGGAPLAYRPSRATARRLRYGEPRLRLGQLGHALDGVAAACALVQSGRAESEPAVQAWLTEAMARDLLAGVRPDGLVVLQIGEASSVLCIEIDEATEHSPEIRRKLAAYDAALAARTGWRLLFVTPGAARSAWLDRVARRERYARLAGKAWAVALPDLVRSGLEASAQPVGQAGIACPLRALASDPAARRCPTPVGTAAWLELLSAGGAEELGDATA